MKIIVLTVLALSLLLCLYFVFLSVTAEVPNSGMNDGKLKRCPDKPNCVISESEGAVREGQYIKPLQLHDTGQSDLDQSAQWKRIAEIVANEGGMIKQQNDQYLLAEYRSRVFRFVDDIEFRLDANQNVVHIRSASRSGTSDLGVNRKRVERIRALLEG